MYPQKSRFRNGLCWRRQQLFFSTSSVLYSVPKCNLSHSLCMNLKPDQMYSALSFPCATTTSPPHDLYTSPPHHLSTSPPHHLHLTTSHHLTTSPYTSLPLHLTTSPPPPQPHTTSPPHHLSTSPSHHLTTSPPLGFLLCATVCCTSSCQHGCFTDCCLTSRESSS